MEITHRLHGIEFEWNKDKAESNSAKHSVDFETACEAFFDLFVMVLESEHHQREVRETLIGMTVHWKFLCVVYVERHGDTFRLISSRPATSAERQNYEEQ